MLGLPGGQHLGTGDRPVTRKSRARLGCPGRGASAGARSAQGLPEHPRV